MVSLLNQAQATKPPTKYLGTGANPKVTPQTLDEIANLMLTGLSLKRALQLSSQWIPFKHWSDSLNRSTKLRAAWEQKEAAVIQHFMQGIVGKPNKEMAVGSCWHLERNFGDEFKTSKGSGVSVNINNVIGIGDDVRSRAKHLLNNANQSKFLKSIAPKDV